MCLPNIQQKPLRHRNQIHPLADDDEKRNEMNLILCIRMTSLSVHLEGRGGMWMGAGVLMLLRSQLVYGD